MTEMKKRESGLRGYKVTNSTICSITNGLTYRGYTIGDLVTNSTFEEVSYLIINGNLPSKVELKDWSQKLIKYRKIPALTKMVMDHIPSDAHPMDVIRTGVSMLGISHPETLVDPIKNVLRVLGVLPSIIGYWYAKAKGKIFKVKDIQETTYAGYLLRMIKEEFSETEKEMMDKSLILYAEHELNASTFSARVCSATDANYYSCIINAICTLSGPKHGGANEAVLNMISKYTNAEEAIKDVEDQLLNNQKVPGFGHPVYLTEDPRSKLIKIWAKKIAMDKDDMKLFEIGEAIEGTMFNKCKDPCTFPNLDFYSAIAYSAAEIESILFTPIFVISRSVGWSAHILEQRETGELIRPMANYIGSEGRVYKSLNNR
ncbi:MAG: citrate/2-methylcitrate synthase [Promethearchaeota archaeon]|jgi:2-methylcitrate synthase